MSSLKNNFSLDCLQSQPIFLDLESYFNVFGPGFVFPASRNLRKPYFRGARFSLVLGRPMGFRGISTSDSCSPRRDCSEKLVSTELDFHWFPVDQWVFEQMDLKFVLHRSQSPQKTLFQRPRFSLVYRRPMGFRGFWTPDSGFPCRDTQEKPVFRKLNFHWFPADQWGPVGDWTLDSCSPQRVTPNCSLKPLTNGSFNRSCFFDLSADERTNKLYLFL